MYKVIFQWLKNKELRSNILPFVAEALVTGGWLSIERDEKTEQIICSMTEFDIIQLLAEEKIITINFLNHEIAVIFFVFFLFVS